jgi:nucleotide-binding universal stress UspA family protein
MSEYPFKRILIPSDFSPHSAAALSLAANLANTFDAELHLLHVIEELLPAVPLDPTGLYGLPPDYDERVKAAVAGELAKVTKTVQTKVPLVSKVHTGSPLVEIVRYARKSSIDVIVMGTHGRTGLAHVVMGSVAESVLRSAPCPVMVVPTPNHKYAAVD